jgi:molybdopterin-guanine dinucleotide biosynthesis protein A
MKIAGAIIAGGTASRMGGCDKLQLLLGSKTVLEELLAIVRPQVDALALDVGRDRERSYQALKSQGICLLSDPFDRTAGPLGGVVAGLAWLQTLPTDYEYLATFPGDCPFLPDDLVSRLATRLLGREGSRPVVAFDGERVHGLCALWPRQMLLNLRHGVEIGTLRSVSRTLDAFGAVRCVIRNDFLNINTTQDLETARHRIREPARPIVTDS